MTAQPAREADEYGVTELPASEARSRISELLDAVADGEFIYLTRRGKRVAALIPADIAENYEKIEDEYWARRAQEARARLASGGDEVIPFDQLVAEAEGARGQAWAHRMFAWDAIGHAMRDAYQVALTRSPRQVA